MKQIVDILDAMIIEAEKSKQDSKGGMEEYVTTLQDSDTFYNEAYDIGRFDALTKLKEALKPFLPTEENEDTEICEGCGRDTPMSEMSDVMTMWICEICEEGVENE